VNDNQLKARVKTVLNGASAEHATAHHPRVGPDGPLHPDHALQVLTLARRTAEEHVGTAKRQADRIRADAQAAADQSARDAQVHAHDMRCEADEVLIEARATAEQAARDARMSAEDAERAAARILAAAKDEAASVVGAARGHAEQLRLQAQQRYEDSVGSLITKREALQEQLETLERFEREYRARLATFMQAQVRALWVDRPQVGDELQAPMAGPDEPGAGRTDADGPDDAADGEPGEEPRDVG